ncbi:MAG: translation initiation factor IF-2 subunit beta [Candidatus Micrarchaeota archaeon]|nr:translation initiation factor IF-2 subunit beta [Candidatus Micrarchaeota archaeon]MDE1851074.1 translation initiation factor IF-2 subunit beta [Candidatus Micrarchaeota archaeon]
MDYEQLLDRAFTKFSGISEEKVDFKIPVADSLVQGSKTILKNIAQIADTARRSKEEIGKYLTKELAAPVSIDAQGLNIGAKVNANSLNEKIRKYFEMYVICKECHKPDTHIQGVERGYITIVCEACGARYTVKNY